MGRFVGLYPLQSDPSGRSIVTHEPLHRLQIDGIDLVGRRISCLTFARAPDKVLPPASGLGMVNTLNLDCAPPKRSIKRRARSDARARARRR